MKTTISAAVIAAFVAGAFSLPQGLAAQSGSSENWQLEKQKTLFRREPRAQDILPKVESRIAALQKDQRTAPYALRLVRELTQIKMLGPGETDERLKDDIDLLQAAATATTTPPLGDELRPLQERYAKLVTHLDDTAFVKDYDRLLKRHDRFIRNTSIGDWNAERIAEELGKLEEMSASAPDIAFGAAESLRGLQDRRLVSVPKLVYMGSHPHEQMYLSRSRRSVAVFEEGPGGSVPMENADLVIQNGNGELVNLDTANNPDLGVPFSPPLGLWMKTRMVEGKVPSVTFRFNDDAVKGQKLGVQDVLDGKLDDYFKKNIKAIADTKEAAVVGLFADFDRGLAANAFGSDGRSPFYIFDPKLPKGSPEQMKDEYLKRAQKGVYVKATWPELSNQYGDPAIPDGPERIRDAWKRLQKMMSATAPNVSYLSTASAYHGSAAAFKYEPEAGDQAWNKLQYYWPGEGVLDWIGVEAKGPVTVQDTKSANLSEAIDPSFTEVQSSSWQSTPVVLRAAAPGFASDPAEEQSWITTLFQKVIPSIHPNIGMVFVDAPDKLTLWSGDAASTYRREVGSNKFYHYPLRFKMLNEK